MSVAKPTAKRPRQAAWPGNLFEDEEPQIDEESSYTVCLLYEGCTWVATLPWWWELRPKKGAVQYRISNFINTHFQCHKIQKFCLAFKYGERSYVTLIMSHVKV